MRVTLEIDDELIRQLEAQGIRVDEGLAETVERALRWVLDSTSSALPPLPTFHGGGSRIDIADRVALYRAIEEEG